MTRIENGQPRITPADATATAIAGFSRRKSADERETEYIENELGKKPGHSTPNDMEHKKLAS